MLRQNRGDQGTALIAAAAILVLLLGLSSAYLQVAVKSSEVVDFTLQREMAIDLAESGIAVALAGLRNEQGVDHDFLGSFSGQMNGGTWTANIEFQPSDPTGMMRRIVSSGTWGGQTRSVEVIVRTGLAHEVFFHALFAGNHSEDPDSAMSFGGGGETEGEPAWVRTTHWSRLRGWHTTWALQNVVISPSSKPDIISGDVHSNGDVNITGNAVVEGVITAHGDIFLPAIEEAVGGGSRKINPPDWSRVTPEFLAATYADRFVDVSRAFSDVGTTVRTNDGIEFRNRQVRTINNSSHPARLFATGVTNDLGSVGSTDRTNYFLGDWWQSSSGESVQIRSWQNEKVYFIDGNLWIETNGYGPTLRRHSSNPDDVRITIVVRGNIYIADLIDFNDPDNDAIALVAISAGESYKDLNMNNQYDLGEPILHDDGNEEYDGDREGSGNIYFGDPNQGPVGHVRSYLYAENSFEDYALGRDVDGGGVPQDIEITGNMTAGDQLNIRRDFERQVWIDGYWTGGTVVPGHYVYTPTNSTSSSNWWRHNTTGNYVQGRRAPNPRSNYSGPYRRTWVDEQLVGATWVPGRFETQILHAQMKVNFDPRIAEGMIMPGIPGQQGLDEQEGWAVMSWRELP